MHPIRARLELTVEIEQRVPTVNMVLFWEGVPDFLRESCYLTICANIEGSIP